MAGLLVGKTTTTCSTGTLAVDLHSYSINTINCAQLSSSSPVAGAREDDNSGRIDSESCLVDVYGHQRNHPQFVRVKLYSSALIGGHPVVGYVNPRRFLRVIQGELAKGVN